ncbi:hypothetical protein [Ktedonobacter racemifer]|uniref:hypothetical protein n=1 Tax=Ktedonobacter racemifer TaxID=363277 RepID=UPI0012FC2556|nr:hypothetical protein [Ktedonobacter racemifer]
MDYEVRTYRAWAASRTGAAEEGETSLDHVPLSVRCWASKLAKWIEGCPYVLHGRLDPLSQEYVIEVREREKPENSWLLEDADQMLRWMRWYHSSQAEQRTPRKLV